jgi:glutaminyl-peptide cyclotransferase
MKTSSRFLSLLILFTLFLSSCQPKPPTKQEFNADRAYADVKAQLAFGFRIPGSDAHQKTVDYISTELKKAGWQVEIQETTYQNHPVQNIIAKRAESTSPIILGAHYDTRMIADNDPDPALQSQPVPGANDGASGVAVLLETARVLPAENKNVWLVFFDTEDQGRIPGWNWILGSTAFAESLKVKPQAVVVIDMIGDSNLNIYREQSSDAVLKDQIWQTASDLGYAANFISEEKYNMVDDHTPFLDKGIPAVDLIDFDYPYWHTTADTADKVSPASLGIVGNTLLSWLSRPAVVGK